MSTTPFQAGVVHPSELWDTLRSYHQRLLNLENGDGSWGWICVDDGSGNPCIPDPILDSVEYCAFQNGWTNAGGDQAPVSFKRFLNWVHIRGGFTGGPDNSVVFTLPPAYAPLYPQAAIGPLGDLSGVYSLLIGVDGTVTYGTAGAL